MGLTNNDIFKKLRVAHKLRDEDIVKICALVDFTVTKSELGAIFRNDQHPKYMECGDQLLRNFLNGLVVHLRGPMPNRESFMPKEAKKPLETRSSNDNNKPFSGKRKFTKKKS